MSRFDPFFWGGGHAIGGSVEVVIFGLVVKNNKGRLKVLLYLLIFCLMMWSKTYYFMVLVWLVPGQVDCSYEEIIGQDEMYQMNVYEDATTDFGKIGLIREDVVSFPNASYISVHFKKFNVPKNEYVIVRSPRGLQSYRYSGLGRGELGLSGGFYATHVKGEKVVIELHRTSPGSFEGHNSSSEFVGYEVDKYARGLSDGTHVQRETVCSEDNSQEAVCYNTEETNSLYEKSKAVARLIIEGKKLCTGWLVGSDNHMMTNHHCIKTREEALNTDFEFDAEGKTCSQVCNSKLACRGVVEASTSSIVVNGEELDYSLVKLTTPTNLASKYGYMTLSTEAPRENDEIYIPQHPQGWGKRISVVVDSGERAKIDKLSVDNSCGKDQVGYMADTQGGSSGAPVLSRQSDAVVALHHCGGCLNTGHKVTNIVAEIQGRGVPLPPNALAPTSARGGGMMVRRQRPTTSRILPRRARGGPSEWTMPGWGRPRGSSSRRTGRCIAPYFEAYPPF